MGDRMHVDESIDEIIDKAIRKIEIDDSEIKKRKPKPFRYIKKEENKNFKSLDDETVPYTIMKSSNKKSNMIINGCLTNWNNELKIDNIIKNHKEVIKHREKWKNKRFK